jgi:hypothetical protein
VTILTLVLLILVNPMLDVYIPGSLVMITTNVLQIAVTLLKAVPTLTLFVMITTNVLKILVILLADVSLLILPPPVMIKTNVQRTIACLALVV